MAVREQLRVSLAGRQQAPRMRVCTDERGLASRQAKHEHARVVLALRRRALSKIVIVPSSRRRASCCFEVRARRHREVAALAAEPPEHAAVAPPDLLERVLLRADTSRFPSRARPTEL